ncbi:hypothetical protein [Enterobacter kobei]|uniref:hypothetical protein n=1 Tax=Enterobacter kobei TaxID=208224 RepID=UPI00064338B8|nr:hypothetical protein [Enterobacter kobei]
MSTITRELAKLFRKITNSEIDAEGNAHVVLSPADSLLINNARIALASLEAEPVCVIDQSNLDYLKSGSDADVWPASRAEMGDVLLYRSATPAPVSVPAAMEMDDDFDSAFEHGKSVGWNAYRAAMLQGADRPQNEPQNIPENIPATQFKQVADLYGLTSPTGGETSFTFDAVEARDFIDGGWSCQEYVELGRFQEAVSGNSPVIPDCWCRTCRPVTFSDSRFVVCPECGNKRCPHANDHRNACTGSNEPGQEGSAYPAAPRQEVK